MNGVCVCQDERILELRRPIWTTNTYLKDEYLFELRIYIWTMNTISMMKDI